MYSGDEIANYFIDKSVGVKSANLTPMKLQKLLYYAHGWSLALTDEPLLEEEPQAWDFGPVFPSIYREFKEFGSKPVGRKALEVEFDGSNTLLVEPAIPENENYESTKALLDRIWHVYGKYDASKLSRMTHEKGSPWDQVREEAKKKYQLIPQGLNIPNTLIQRWFKNRFQKGAA